MIMLLDFKLFSHLIIRIIKPPSNLSVPAPPMLFMIMISSYVPCTAIVICVGI